METNKHKIIFAHGKCISEDVLIAYANNTLSAKEKHVVEKHTLGCDMCADALEGIMMMRNPSQLKGITESLNKRIGGAGTERKPIVLWMDTRVRVAIAAGLALLIGFFFLFNNSFNGDNAGDTTVSENIKQNEALADSTSMSLGESKKTDSVSDRQQIATTGKELDKGAKNDRTEKGGEVVTFTDANGGPGNNVTNTSHATGGDALKSTKDQREGKSEPPPPPKDAQQNGLAGFNDITTLDRSKSVDDKKFGGQIEKKPNADAKDKEEKDDESNVERKVTVVTSTVTSNESVSNSNQQKIVPTYSGSGNVKTDAPKKEEKEKIVKNDSGKKSKSKSSAYPEVNQPDEKSNKGGKDNLEDQVQSQTVVTGGTTASPNMVPQTTKTEQEVTLSKNKEVSFDADGSYRNDTLKFKTALDSTSKYGYYGVGEVSGEKKYAEKDYSGAVLIFSKTLETKPTDREALYKLGDSYLQLNKPDQAIVQFDKLIVMGKGAYYDAARYDKSQALLKQKKNAEAKKLLMEIEQTSTEYKSRAKVDLDKIK